MPMVELGVVRGSFSLSGIFFGMTFHAKLVDFDVAQGENDGAMPHERRAFFEHGKTSFRMEC